MKKHPLSLLIVALLATAPILSLVGCNSAPPPVVQAKQVDIDKAIQMREFFVKANGNYDSLDAAAKADYVKLAGSEAAGKAQWELMSKNKPGAPSGSGDPRGK